MYRKANAILPTADATFDMADVERRLGHVDRARVFFEAYLVPPGPHDVEVVSAISTAT